MPQGKQPPISELLDELERRRSERQDEVFRAASERRRAADRFRRLRREVILPVCQELRRELRRRRHSLKVVERDDAVTLTAAVQTRHVRHGSLRLVHPGKSLDSLRIEYEGIEILPDRFDVSLEKVDRQLVTKAVLRLVEGLLAE